MSPKLPRDVSGHDLAAALATFGYRTSRQTGSHLRLTTDERGGHHVTVPAHGALKVGTLSGILGEVARHFEIPKRSVIERLFG